jgi:hypothetical protein
VLVPGSGGEDDAEARRTALAKSTGMPAGCGARPLTWPAVRALGCVPGSIPAAEVVGAGLAAEAEAEQGFVAAWRVSCTPVSSMLTAP